MAPSFSRRSSTISASISLSSPLALANSLTPRSSSHSKSLSPAQIGGIIASCILSVVVVSAGLFLFFRSRRHRGYFLQKSETKRDSQDTYFTSNKKYDPEAEPAINEPREREIENEKDKPNQGISFTVATETNVASNPPQPQRSTTLAPSTSTKTTTSSCWESQPDHYSVGFSLPHYSLANSPIESVPTVLPTSYPASSYYYYPLSSTQDPSHSPPYQQSGAGTIGPNENLNPPPSFSTPITHQPSSLKHPSAHPKQDTSLTTIVAAPAAAGNPNSENLNYKNQPVSGAPPRSDSPVEMILNKKVSTTSVKLPDPRAVPSDEIPSKGPHQGNSTVATRVAAWRQNLPYSSENLSTPYSYQQTQQRKNSAIGPNAASNFQNVNLDFLSVDPELSVASGGVDAPAATIASTTGSVMGDLAWILTGGQVHNPPAVDNNKKLDSPSIYTASTAAGVDAYGFGPLPRLTTETNAQGNISSKTTKSDSSGGGAKRPPSEAMTLPSYYTNESNGPSDPNDHLSSLPTPASVFASSAIFAPGDFEEGKSVASVMTDVDVSVQPQLIGIGMTPSTRRRMDRNKMTLKDFDKLVMLDNVPPVPAIPRIQKSTLTSSAIPVLPELPSFSDPIRLPEPRANNYQDKPLPSIAAHTSQTQEQPNDRPLLNQSSVNSLQNIRPMRFSMFQRNEFGFSRSRMVAKPPPSNAPSNPPSLDPCDSEIHDTEPLKDKDEVDMDQAEDMSLHSAAMEMLAHRQRQRSKRFVKGSRHRLASNPGYNTQPGARWLPVSRGDDSLIESGSSKDPSVDELSSPAPDTQRPSVPTAGGKTPYTSGSIGDNLYSTGDSKTAVLDREATEFHQISQTRSANIEPQRSAYTSEDSLSKRAPTKPWTPNENWSLPSAPEAVMYPPASKYTISRSTSSELREHAFLDKFGAMAGDDSYSSVIESQVANLPPPLELHQPHSNPPIDPVFSPNTHTRRVSEMEAELQSVIDRREKLVTMDALVRSSSDASSGRYEHTEIENSELLPEVHGVGGGTLLMSESFMFEFLHGEGPMWRR